MADNTTQRAYTLRLAGTDPNDNSWRDPLWQTHEAVNKGVWAFGNWLLTMRGGLAHELADAPVEGGAKPAKVELRNRRILLALSWLSVESAAGAPAEYIVATGKEPEAERQRKVVAALAGILRKRGLKAGEVESWVADCRDSLSAAIRDDAAWVNRSAAFDKLASEWNGLSPASAEQLICHFFGDIDEFLHLPDPEKEGTGQAESDTPFSNKARAWLSTNWGSGEKSDKAQIACALFTLAQADLSDLVGRPGQSIVPRLIAILEPKQASGQCEFDTLRQLVGWSTGRSSKGRVAVEKFGGSSALTAGDIEALQLKLRQEAEEKAEKASVPPPPWVGNLRAVIESAVRPMRFVLERDLIGEFSVMLDHAARRLSVAHSWQKLAEAQRQKLAEYARRSVVPEVEKWLDDFLEERARASGALEPIQIRRRAVGGWQEVVKAWSACACEKEDDRRKAARELQGELDKFGDIALFEALAADDAKVVWHRNGKPDPQPLLDYVFARDAQFKMRRFKVPAYRHPDALRHPVFCEFGDSRWFISFAVHEAAKEVGRAKAAVQACEKDFAEASGKAERDKAEARLLKRRKDLDTARAAFASAPSNRGIEMRLWNGTQITAVNLRWQSKRLAADLALNQAEPAGTPVSRADRLGRAAAGVTEAEPVAIRNVFDEKYWNGRLQAPRDQLERLAHHVDRHGWDEKARRLRDRLDWFVTFSPRLQPQDKGPWPAYIEKLALAGDADAFAYQDAKGVMKTGFVPHREHNRGRSLHARLGLCRLPGLRVLSVDLGHRYAAACAVWETLTEKEMERICREADRKPPQPGDLAVHIDSRRAGKPTRTVYRRTGPDMWAVLDRQFLVKLQGEDRPARKASAAEHEAVAALETGLGRVRSDDEALPWRVSELMSEALRTARWALRRHGNRARIAFNLTADRKPLPGGRWQPLDEQARIEFLQDTLLLWYGLFSGNGWKDEWARELWNRHIAAELPAPPDEGASSPARRAHSKQVKDLLRDPAARLARDPQLRQELSAAWAARWHEDDRQWRSRLRWLRGWLLPRRAAAGPAIRQVGGLTLDRLANIRELWQTMKAYHTRPEPDNVRKNVPEKADSSLDKFGQRILDALERMRDNRVKQLASRIVEAALGVGNEKEKRGARRPTVPVYAPCHAIVIEDLENYRPEQTRVRRENRQLMIWSARRVAKYLTEACQLHGLYLDRVMPNYTSLQDSRTGAPGIRCIDQPVADFLKWCRSRIEKPRESDDAERRYLVDLYNHWQGRDGNGKTVRIPRQGGNLFVSVLPDSPAAKGLQADLNAAANITAATGSEIRRSALQADLNAAANIGLRALLDPDWPGKWWWIPCGRDGKPARDKCKGTAAFALDAALLPEWSAGKDIANAWRDVSSAPVDSGGWQNYSDYWNGVMARAVERLRKWSGLSAGH